MITAADLLRWADEQSPWLNEFSFSLSVDYLRGQRMVKHDEPWHILVLQHASGHYSTMQIMKFDNWPEARLQNILKQMMDVAVHHIRDRINKLHAIGPWSGSVDLKIKDHGLEDDSDT